MDAYTRTETKRNETERDAGKQKRRIRKEKTKRYDELELELELGMVKHEYGSLVCVLSGSEPGYILLKFSLSLWELRLPSSVQFYSASRRVVFLWSNFQSFAKIDKII